MILTTAGATPLPVTTTHAESMPTGSVESAIWTMTVAGVVDELMARRIHETGVLAKYCGRTARLVAVPRPRPSPGTFDLAGFCPEAAGVGQRGYVGDQRVAGRARDAVDHLYARRVAAARRECPVSLTRLLCVHGCHVERQRGGCDGLVYVIEPVGDGCGALVAVRLDQPGDRCAGEVKVTTWPGGFEPPGGDTK